METAKLGDSLFRAYDVRGIYPKDLDESTAVAVGAAFGEYIGKGKKIAVCRDVRTSGESLEKAVLRGLSSYGLEMIDIGIAPTPMVHFAVSHYNLDGGIMVTASHNPAEWNGFKFYGRGSETIGLENGLAEIRESARQGRAVLEKRIDIIDRSRETLMDYEQFLLGKVNIRKGLRVGIDPGNGSYAGIARETLEKAGAEVFAINDSQDGTFPGRSPEPKEETLSGLRELVTGEKLDLGIAFDADGDRGIFVDSKGRVLRGDLALALFAKNIIKKGEKLAFDVSCSDLVGEELRKSGGIPVVTRVGRAFVPKAMRESGAIMGGELSGHTYFAEAYCADDPLLAGLAMMGLISQREKALAGLVDELPHYETVALELKVDDSIKFKVIEFLAVKLAEGNEVITIDGVKVRMRGGWFILRASNTGPAIRLVAEARDRKDLDSIVNYAKTEFDAACGRMTA